MLRYPFLLPAFFLFAFPAIFFGQGPGKLFIIGGGSRPEPMRRELIQLGGLEAGRYAVILPMSSAETDSAIYFGRMQFLSLGIPSSQVTGFQLSRDHCPQNLLDSLAGAGLIYISGGDQNRFMAAVKDSPIPEAIWQAYRNGAVIAGTSAGAAVMSRLMITGNQLRYEKNGSSFRNIETDNVELAPGLGFLTHAVVDQHFVYRMRLNRLISVVLEHPELLGIGIDEATAIVVEGNKARVTGKSQVILLQTKKGKQASRSGALLGTRDLRMQVLLPGDRFKIRN